MPESRIAPCGSWKSPITSDLIVADTIGLDAPRFDGDSTYWLEMRPSEGGRLVLVRRSADGRATDLTPQPYNVRTRVHEYGGGAYTVAEGVVVFSNFKDQRLYRLDPGGAPRAITPEAGLRYADAVFDRGRNLLFCVREDHRGPGEAINTLARVKCDGDESGGEVIVSGNDFYASPRLSPDGSRLAWLTWNHPNMPWDGTELWVGEVDAAGSIGRAQCIAGGREESIYQPEWSPDGVLHFVSDRTGWWNLYRWQEGCAEALCPMEAEFGEPQWVFGVPTYAFETAGRIICKYIQSGVSHLASLDPATRQLAEIVTPYTAISHVSTSAGHALFLGGSPTEMPAVVRFDLSTRRAEILRRSSAIDIDPGYVSIAREIEFPTEDGLTAFGLFYPPRNKDFTSPPGERPPLRVLSHGGPTGASDAVLDAEIQYWTSRGIAVFDVNYGGSTGYGRAYRQRLNGGWGIVDVNDCVNGARYLVEAGEADGDRLIIREEARAGTRLCACSPSATSSRRARATTASPTSRRLPQTRTSSSPVTWTTSSVHTLHAAIYTWSAPRSTLPIVSHARSFFSRGRRIRSSFPISPGRCMRLSRPRGCRWPIWSLRASSTASARPRTSNARSMRSCTSTPGFLASSWRTRSNRSRSRICRRGGSIAAAGGSFCGSRSKNTQRNTSL